MASQDPKLIQNQHQKRNEKVHVYKTMSSHIYIPYLHIFVYVCMFAHSQLYYVQVNFNLNIVPGCGHHRGMYNIPRGKCYSSKFATARGDKTDSHFSLILVSIWFDMFLLKLQIALIDQ